jgi:hypothetical protein
MQFPASTHNRKGQDMTDFKDWYAKTSPTSNPEIDDFLGLLQCAFEAGAASQAGTLRDEFAMAALTAMVDDRRLVPIDRAFWAYNMADAMFEARKDD